MIVKLGTVVESEFGMGAVVAITKQWLIHLAQDGSEIGIYLPDQMVWVPAEFDGVVETTSSEIEIEE